MENDEESSLQPAADLSDQELEELVRVLITVYFRSDVARAAAAWLDERLAVYKFAHPTRH